MMRVLLPSLAVAFNPCRRGELYISESQRCITAPEVYEIPEYLERHQRQYNEYDATYNSYADNNDCDDGYEWYQYDRSCHDIDECSSGTHDCDSTTQACHNMEGTFNCICAAGYEIKLDSENSLTQAWKFDAEHPIGECVDINECETQCAGPGQMCTNSAGSFECTCEPGYVKSPHALHLGIAPFGSCQDINECADDPCGANESCRNWDGGFECVCYKDHNRNSNGVCTAESPCETAGQVCQWKCHDVDDTFRCECPPGYTLIGNMCLDENECAEGYDTCDDHQLCLNIHGGYVCTDFTVCPNGFDSVRGWVDEFNRVKQDTNICHKSTQCDESMAQCQYNVIVSHSSDLLSNNQHSTEMNRHGKGKGTRLYRFETTARYGSSATYGYKIMDVKNGKNGNTGSGESVLQKEEFAISQRYHSRPRAYLMSLKPIIYSEDEDHRRDLEIEYFAKHRRSGKILYQELIKVRVFISKYEF